VVLPAFVGYIPLLITPLYSPLSLRGDEGGLGGGIKTGPIEKPEKPKRLII
jgi:hypothetical protein